MRILITCFILIHVSVALSAEEPKKKSATVKAATSAKRAPTAVGPTQPMDVKTGKALLDLAAECKKATDQTNGRIHPGSVCTEKANTADAHDGLDPETKKLIESMKFKEYKYDAYVQSKTPQSGKIKGPTEDVVDANGSKIQVSVMTPDEAIALHQNLLKDRFKELKLDYETTGCVARAHTLGIDLENQGIAVGKIWSYPGPLAGFGVGKLNPILPNYPNRDGADWRIHVAPFVLVKKDQNSPAEKWVIDPAFNRERPLPIDQYRSQLTSNPRLTYSPVISSRFVYTDNQIYSNLKNHLQSDLNRYGADLQTTVNDIRNGTRGGKVVDSNPF